METNTYSPILTCSLEIPTTSFFQSSHLDNNDFQAINTIIVDFCTGLRGSIKEEKSLSKIITDIKITTDLNAFSKGVFSFTFHIQTSELIQDLSIIKQSIKEFIILSMDMIVAERYYTSRSYSFNEENTPTLSFNEENSTLSIQASHKIISFIANKIQHALVKLYQLNENTVIKVLIDNETILIPGIETTIQSTKKHKSESPEQCTAILHNGNQAKNNCKFQITIGTSEPRALTQVETADDEQLSQIRIKARYEDPVIVEIYYLTKDLRGVPTPIPDIEFVRLISDDSVTQLQLLSLDRQ